MIPMNYRSAAVAVLALSLCGCSFVESLGGNSAERTAALRDAAAKTAQVAEAADKGIAYYTERSAKIESMLQGMSDGPIKDELVKAKATADAKIVEYREVFDKAVLTSKTLADEMSRATNDLDTVQAVVTAAAPWIPGPWGGLVATLAPVVFGLIGGLIGKRKGEGDAKAIAAAVESAKTPDGVVNFADPQTVKILDAYLTAHQKAIIDAGQKLAA